MSSEEIQVSIGARIDELIAGFNQAAQEVGASLAKIEANVVAVSTSMQSKLAPAAQAAQESLKGIGTSAEGIGGALGEMRSAMSTAMEVTGAALLLETFSKVKEALDQMADRAIEFQHVGEEMGIGAVALQGLEAAADEAGISTSRLERTMLMVQQRMQMAALTGGVTAEQFNKLGISNDQLGDSSFTATEAMERLGAASNTNAQLIGLLGARGAAMIPMLREMAENHNLAGEAAAKVNALLPSEIAVMEAYHASVATATTQMENFATRMLSGAVPAIQEMINEFGELATSSPVLSALLDGIGEVLKSIVVGATQLAYAFKGAIDTILNGLELVIDPIAGLGAAMVQVAHGDFTAAKDTMVAAFHNIGSNWHNLMSGFDADVAQGEAAVARMKAAVSGLAEVHPNLQHEEMPTHTAVPDKDAQKAQEEAAKQALDTQLAGIQQQMALVKDQAKNFQITAEQELAIEKELIGQKLAAEMAYYEKMKSLAAGKSADIAKASAGEAQAQNQADMAMLQATLAAADAMRKAQVDAATQAAQSSLDTQLAGLKQQESALQDAAKTHQMTLAQELSGEREIIGEELAARMAFYEQMKKLAEGNERELDKINRQEVQASAAAATQMQQAQQKASDQMRQSWQNASNQISSTFAGHITAMLEGTQTFANSMRSMFAQMVSSIVGSLVKVIVQMEINNVLGKALGQDQAKSNILANAAQAASAAMASAAEVPVIGYILAPIAGAAIYAAALAFPMAEKGFDVPSGMNPITQLHAQEMVLPANLANAVRGMAANGGTGEQENNRTAPPPLNLQVAHGDPGNYLMRKEDLHGLVRNMQRRFQLR